MCTSKQDPLYESGKKHIVRVDQMFVRLIPPKKLCKLTNILYELAKTGLGRTEEMLHSENQQGVERLSSKVSRLNKIALEMHDETQGQNKYIDDMGGDFESTQGLLGGTVNRLSHMVSANKGNRKLMCYLIIGLVIVFFVFYYLIGKVTS